MVSWELWREIGDRVFVRRNRTLDVNVGLVLGEDRCLVIDTRGSDREAREVVEAVRRITPTPYVVALTHAHFDHSFGAATFADHQPGCEIWAHRRAREDLVANGEQQRAAMTTWLDETGLHDVAAEVDQVRLVPPTHTVDDGTTIDLGGREVRLHHPGAGHTDHDLVVEIDDCGVTFVGDLVEQGASPSFDDSFPLDWPGTLDALIERLGRVVVPGHGDVVDGDFVARQRMDIAEVGQVARHLPARTDDRDLERVAGRLAVGGPAGFLGLRRAREQLAER